MISKGSSKEDIVKAVDDVGILLFDNWYKNTLTYKNDEFTVVICPEYRDTLGQYETLDSLLRCEDYGHVYVFGGIEKPYSFEWYKEGDMA